MLGRGVFHEKNATHISDVTSIECTRVVKKKLFIPPVDENVGQRVQYDRVVDDVG